MPEPRPRGFLPGNFESSSWISRVLENLQQLFTTIRLKPTSANGVPLHLLKLETTGRASRSQTASLLTHLGVLLVLSIALVSRPPDHGPEKTGAMPLERRAPHLPRMEWTQDRNSLGRKGGGGNSDPLPATRGFFAPRSPIQLARPRLPDNADHILPVTAAILDQQAPLEVASMNPLGIPWMRDDTMSGGPGANHGIGSGRYGDMGDGTGPGAGDGEGNDYRARGGTLPTCLICPTPIYTDEARHVKMQGTVTLRVRVDTDGKATDIRVLRGVGFGLEERAIQSVRGWKFRPARDAAQRTVAAWVTVEVVFRLF